jgi:hypothetical protein
MTNLTAPDITPGYPSKGRKLGPAWVSIWQQLSQAEDALDGRELAEDISGQHDLAPATLVGLIQRAAQAGILNREPREVASGRGPRTRTFYRIAPKVETGE